MSSFVKRLIAQNHHCSKHYLLQYSSSLTANEMTTCEDQSDPSSTEDESESESNETEHSLKNELADIPLGELQEIREKIGTKKFDSMMKESLRDRETSSFKRANKNRPREMSSKRPVSRFREVVAVTKAKRREIRDPRFEEGAGQLNQDLFKKSYAFVDDMKKKEKLLIQKEVKKTKNTEKKAQLQSLLVRMDNQEAMAEKEKEKKALLKEHKRRERELTKHGKKPFYLKKSTHKKLELAEKYGRLKKSGKLDKFLAKKRRKNASRDRRDLPYVRS